MKSITWEEESYSDSKCFEIKTGNISITITNGHIDNPGEWVMHCYDLGIKTHSLNVKTIREAQLNSVEIVKTILNNMINDLNSISYKG